MLERVLLAVDVAYDEATRRGLAAGVVFSTWSDKAPIEERVRACEHIAPYEPGAFFRRELPCVLPLIEELLALCPIKTVIVDGYVDLGEQPGLGRHIVDALSARGIECAVVGIAKSRFWGAQAIEVFRGASKQPLFVTAHGLDPRTAADHVRAMDGEHRVPSLLRRVDQLARGSNRGSE
jgi:deoxyribonuclease V